MEILAFASNLIIPTLFVTIIFYGYSKGLDIFELFKEGAIDGVKTVYEIFPTLLGLIISVGVLNASGALQLFSDLIEKPVSMLGYPVEAIPLTFMRLVSSSASIGLITDILKEHGPDSYIGRFVSVMMSSTETVMYTMSVYFMSVKVTKTRYTLLGALISNLAGVIASLWITKIAFGY